MLTVVSLVAQWAVFVVPAGALLVWWRAGRRDKAALAVAAVVTLVLAGIGIELAALLWTDPRPFVVDGRTALVPHAADNGFPSDHTTLGAAVAAVVLAWRRRVGAALLVVAAAVGAARVAAHIHHVPDVLAGLAIGAACAGVGVVVARRCVAWAAGRRGATPRAAA
ncbi:phosphatase PAP2 family protein [Georgenia ruanii]|uniref:phosphatase PAP2 family protein n=1 Tax=Georgenia ruanii TaxID=348442 RepID=UPI00186AD4D7|nr:phosphatase PAP2 family protein [Georgenia ruanii]